MKVVVFKQMFRKTLIGIQLCENQQSALRNQMLLRKKVICGQLQFLASWRSESEGGGGGGGGGDG